MAVPVSRPPNPSGSGLAFELLRGFRPGVQEVSLELTGFLKGIYKGFYRAFEDNIGSSLNQCLCLSPQDSTAPFLTGLFL